MKKWLCMLLSVMMVLTVPSLAFAGDESSDGDFGAVDNPVVLDCGYYSYTLNNLSEDDAVVTKTKDDAEGIEYEVHDKNDLTSFDTIHVDFEPLETISQNTTNASDTRSTYFTRTKTIKDSNSGKTVVTLEFSTRVDLYESGSFRSFYGADTPNLTVKTNVTPISLSNTAKSIKSTTGSFPTTSLTYAYSTNLKTTTTVSSTIGAQLEGAGFSVSSGSNTYYYKTVKETGTIDLY